MSSAKYYSSNCCSPEKTNNKQPLDTLEQEDDIISVTVFNPDILNLISVFQILNFFISQIKLVGATKIKSDLDLGTIVSALSVKLPWVEFSMSGVFMCMEFFSSHIDDTVEFFLWRKTVCHRRWLKMDEPLRMNCSQLRGTALCLYDFHLLGAKL